MSDDKLQCILAVCSTLRQLLQSIRRDPNAIIELGPYTDGPIHVGERNGKVTFSECSDFVDLISSLFADAAGNYDELQALLINIDPTLIPTLVSFLTIAPAILAASSSAPAVAFPSAAGDGDDAEAAQQQQNNSMNTNNKNEPTPFEKLILSVIQSIVQIVTLGCIDAYESPQRSRDGSHGVSDLSKIPPEGKKLSEMLGAMFQRVELAQALVVLLDSASSPAPIIRFGASKLLFTAVIRVPAVKASLVSKQALLDGMFDTSLAEGNHKIRSYTVGALREIAGSHPAELTASDDNIKCFARLFATDALGDVRAMAAEAVDVIYRNQPQKWAKCGAKRDLSIAIIGRLEGDEANDGALIAILRLLETLLIADAALTLGKPQPTQPSPQNPTSFIEFFAFANGERSLVVTIKGTRECDSLAARCLRLLIEFAPFYCEVSFNLARHFPSIAVILKAVVALASDKSDNTFVSDMRFELSLAVALMLCQDPRSRQLLSEELRANSVWMGKLRGALLSNLNHATLSDFSGIRIIDVCGDHLTNIRNVQWEEEAQRPLRDSLEAFMMDQYFRFIEFEQMGGHQSAPARAKGSTFIREVPVPDPNGESLETRLTFVLLTNTAHNTFNASRRQTLPDGSDLPIVIAPHGNRTADASNGGGGPYSAGRAISGMLLRDLGQDLSTIQQNQQQMFNERNAHKPPRSRPVDLNQLLNQSGEQAMMNGSGDAAAGGDSYQYGVSGSDQQQQGQQYDNNTAIINELSKVNKSLLTKASNAYLPPASGLLPGQTRTSLIREWKTNPKKLEAIKAMAKQAQAEASSAAAASQQQQQQQVDGEVRGANFVRGNSGSRSNSAAATPRTAAQHMLLPPNPSQQYRTDNFVNNYADPFLMPTRDSFKKPPKATLNTLVAASQRGGFEAAGRVSVGAPKPPAGPTYLSKFDASLKLFEKVGQHYAPIAAVVEEAVTQAARANTTVFETTGDGFAKRKSNISTSSSATAAAKRQPKTWCIDDLREGDLFYFAIPLNTMSAFAVDQVRIQAVRHLNHLKRSYLVIPNTMKGRRWFIFDASTHIMPAIIACLDDILELMETHGEQNCRFPLLMFKEGEFAKQASPLRMSAAGGVSGGGIMLTSQNLPPDAVPEGTLNSGNLFESLDQLRFYFSKMSEVNPVAATANVSVMGGGAGGIGSGQHSVAVAANTSQYLIDLENKINSLKTRKFEPRTDAKFMTALGGVGPTAILGNSAKPPNQDGYDEDDYDESQAVPYSSAYGGSATHNQQQNNSSSIPLSLSATRARAMLHSHGEFDEVEAIEPLGTAGRAASMNF